jgi:hypothetical protein
MKGKGKCVSALVRKCGSELQEGAAVVPIAVPHSRTHALTHYAPRPVACE